MEHVDYELNSREKMIKKSWLLLIVFSNTLYPILKFFFTDTFSSIENPLLQSPVTFFLGTFALNLLILWLFWYCSYKKQGTKLLLFSLILGPPSMLISIPELLKHPRIDLILDFVFFVAYYVLSFKLWKINKTIKLNKQKNPQYLEAIQKLTNVASLEELNQRFYELMQLYPQFESGFSKEYAAKKVELTKLLKV